MIRPFLKKTYFSASALLRLDVFRRRTLVHKHKAAVLNLHRISPDSSPYWPPLAPNVFESLVNYLDKYFEVRSISDLNEKQGKRPVAVMSFDDGYYDFIEYAMPLLRKYGMRANMNIVAECVETGNPIWNVRLYDFLAQASKETIDKISLKGFVHNLGREDAASKTRFGIELSKFLKNRSREERKLLFQPIEELMTKINFPGTRMMNSDEIRQIASETEIGAHSYSHESMGHEDHNYFEADTAKCSDYFSEKLGLPLHIYAFPNGSYRAEQVDFLQRRGVKMILLVDEKMADLGTTVVPRITMYGETFAEVQMRAVGLL